METNSWSKLWKCPPLNNGIIQWWCGNESETTACQTGINAYFPDYTSGSILGFPPVRPSPSAATRYSSYIVPTTISAGAGSNVITVSGSSSAKPATKPLVSAQIVGQSTGLPTGSSVPAQAQEHSASLPTAIGAGIGVPLGIATIGILGFLFWKEAVRQRRSNLQTLRQETMRGNEDSSPATAIEEPRAEFPDTPLPRELGDTGKTEIPSN